MDDDDFDEYDDIDDDFDDDMDDGDDLYEQSEPNAEDGLVAQSQSDDEKEDLFFEQLLIARDDRLDELRDYADERELDEVLLLIPYCNPVYHTLRYLSELIDPKNSDEIATTILSMTLFSFALSESPRGELQRQAKEYNVNYTFPDAAKESEEYQKLFPLLSKFCMLHDPFRDFNKVFSKLKDDDRAMSWCYLPKEAEITLGDIKQQLSLKNEFSYVGMMDYKTILPLSELEKYSEMKGYMGKKIKIAGVRYIVWVTEKEFKKLGEICSQLDSKQEIFKQECTKLAHQFLAVYTERQNLYKKWIAEENKVKKQREELEQESKLQNENYKKKKQRFITCRILILLLPIVGLGILEIVSENLIVYGVISSIIFIILGFILIRKPKKPKILEEIDMPQLPEEPVNKENPNTKALDIFLDVLSCETLKAENRKQIAEGST